MKILKKEVKICDDTTKSCNNKTTVLDLTYSHKGMEGRILIQDYFDDEKTYQFILKQLRVEVRKAFNLKNIKSEA